MWVGHVSVEAAVVDCLVAAAVMTGWTSDHAQLPVHHVVAACAVALRAEIRLERGGRHVQAFACCAHVAVPFDCRLPVEIRGGGVGAVRAALMAVPVHGSVPTRGDAVVENDPYEREDDGVSVTGHALVVKDLEDPVHALSGGRPDGKGTMSVLLR